jgi:hypothetical protein
LRALFEFDENIEDAMGAISPFFFMPPDTSIREVDPTVTTL